MISTKLFKPMSEAYCAKILGTGTDGTPPSRLMSNIKNLGLGITRMTRNSVNVKNALAQYKGVLCHYETKAANCSGFHNNYGHYCVIKGIIGNEYIIYDPTRGEFKCKFEVMDKATNGRELFYYAIDLL
jgi:ABC-type bacteriocin/lantibiotic exporter with double-glycine peptidase domain